MSGVPQNFPPPQPASASVGFEPAPTGASLCGFGIPGFSLSIKLPSFSLPSISFSLPTFALGLNCDLSNPLSVGFGGGRVSGVDPDADPDYQFEHSP
jgi:hypothetical protein